MITLSDLLLGLGKEMKTEPTELRDAVHAAEIKALKIKISHLLRDKSRLEWRILSLEEELQSRKSDGAS
jgi:hypothetical protein